MKVFVVFALFVLAINADLCAKKGADLTESQGLKDTILSGGLTIFGHCVSLDLDGLLNGPDCKPLFDQGYCYSQLAIAHYGDLDVVNYGHLAEDLPNIQHIAKLSCKHLRSCVNSVKDAFKACDAADDAFVNKAITKVEKMYRDHGESIVAAYASENSNTIVGELISLLRNRVQSVQDIRDLIDSYVTDDIISDAEDALAAIDAAAVEWCDSNCHRHTHPFLKQLFKSINKGECDDASEFCGPCEALANEFLKNENKRAVPCCLDNIIQKSLAGVAYIEENYSDMISNFRDYLSGELSDDAVARAIEIRDRILEEIACLKSSYVHRRIDRCGLPDPTVTDVPPAQS